MASATSPSDFVIGKLLGEGAFGKVFLCHEKMDKSRKYAMKVIDLSKSPPEERDAAVRESKLLQQLKHEHIVAYVSSFKERASLCIVTEYCDGGDLSEVLEQRRERALAEDQIVNWFGQICRALKYLHIRNILHRDIKTQNVFLTGPKKDAKLGDLGIAKVLDRRNSKAVTMCGTPSYMSPEIFQFKPYDTKSDIWALGVVVYEMTTLEKPFDAMFMQQLVFQVVHGKLPPMPKKNTVHNPSTRPSAVDILNNPLFATFKKNKTRKQKTKYDETQAGNKDANIKFQFNTDEGLVIKLYKKHIARLKVDAIVNAANHRLANVGGVADVIAKAAGFKMAQECNHIITQEGQIFDGDNVVTSAGNLPYQAVIHAVGPRWHEYKNKAECLNILKITISNILDTARSKNFKCVAMPPISSGVCGVPKSMCAAMYLRGIYDFSKQGKLGSMKEFHIIDIHDDILDMINDWHSKLKKNPRCLDFDAVLSGSDGVNILRNYRGKTDIHIYTKDILKIRGIDVIVVSEDSLVKGEGGLSRTLLAAGCDQYRHEHRQLQPQSNNSTTGLSRTVVLMTSGGHKLPFKHVLHAILRREKGDTEEMYQTVLWSTIDNVLSTVNALDMKSKKDVTLAIPMIGLGAKPSDEIMKKCCWTLKESITKFLELWPSIHISEIHLVNNFDTTTRLLQQMFHNTKSSR
ncbi:NEK1_4_5 [Mytilus coruscus]|uniref:non-specific serine/threonine protein kinase n=1 Tax=Mytilus coruscus TaxID=42192 RepID=A0A6J8CHM6_MYTCO|nr:NEK1_4_5 [Mytilus coruscus]